MQPEIHIWTIQIGQWRLAKTQNIFLLDTTAKTGHRAFAPLMTNVMKYKRKELSEEQYTALYLSKMEQSQEDNPRAWASLKHHPRIAFACYCKAGDFCHRHLFTELAAEYLEKSGCSVVRAGELTA
jgi:hypothetical protein